MSMKSKIGVVTGSTQGLGEAISRKLIREGLQGLVICGRNKANGERLAKEFTDAGCKTVFVAADLANAGDCQRIVDAAAKTFGRVDVLVNAAGMTDRGTWFDTTPELFDRMFAVNTRAPFFLIQGAAKLMVQNKSPGAIVNILSMSSHGGQPFIAAYCGSKGALATLTKNAAYALMRHKIRVIGLNIGWMDSPGEHAVQKKFHNADDRWLEAAEKNQPFGRLLKTDEVAETVAFLLSEKAGLMTGTLIDFDQNVIGAYS